MYKKIITVLVILCLFILTSCAKEIMPSTTPFIGGTQGLELGFYEGAPPSEVFDGGEFPFDVVVKIKNNGEWFIAKEDITIIVNGIRPEEFGKTIDSLTTKPVDDIEAMRKDAEGNIIESTPVFVEFLGLNHVTPIVGTAQPFPFRARACYGYGTTANALLCVRKDLMTQKEGVCKINEEKTVYNSGAPVQFSGLKESRRAANKIGFIFKITHVGKGDLFKQESECDFKDRTSLDRLYVVVDSAMHGLSCSGFNPVAESATAVEATLNLYGGEKIVSCSQEIESPSDYEFPVIFEAKYTYLDGVETEVVVKHTEI